MIYKKFIQISFLNWIEFTYQPWSKFNNLFAFFFVTWDMLFIWHSLRDCKIVERVLNEEILSEMGNKVRNKKLWKEEQMVRVRKSFNQVNTLHQLGKKKIMAWIFNLFDRKWKAKILCRYILQRKLPKKQCRLRTSYKSYHMVYVQTASAETIKATK